VFPVKYKLVSYISFRRNSVFKVLSYLIMWCGIICEHCDEQASSRVKQRVPTPVQQLSPVQLLYTARSGYAGNFTFSRVLIYQARAGPHSTQLIRSVY
jgi:hypothetical protein